MNYQIIINPELGGNDTGKSYNNTYEKDYNLRFAKELNNKLNEFGISSILTRNSDISLSDKERINYINNNINSKTIIVTVGLGSNDIEIVYGLNSKDTLAKRLADNFEENKFTVSKYYQRRSSSNTKNDYDSIISNLPYNESIIIRLGNISNIDYLNQNTETLVNIIVNVLKSYLGLSNDTYVVKKGDNLYSIARQFNTTVDTIKKLNNLTSNNLSIGQKLIIKSIPTNIDNNNYYIVKNGDTLYSIARLYNISVTELQKVNNITNNLININQRLIIPNTNTIKYTVKKGDSLYSIASKYNTTVKDIMNINNLKNTTLSINQILTIPK